MYNVRGNKCKTIPTRWKKKHNKETTEENKNQKIVSNLYVLSIYAYLLLYIHTIYETNRIELSITIRNKYFCEKVQVLLKNTNNSFIMSIRLNYVW